MDSGWLAGDSGRLMYTSDGGATWAHVSTGSSFTLYSVEGWYGRRRGETLELEAPGVISQAVRDEEEWGDNMGSFENIIGKGDMRRWAVVSSTTIVAVGAEGIILRSVDSGSTWSSEVVPDNRDLYDVHFLSDGFYGTLYRTTDAGASWTVSATGTGNALLAVYFIDANIGWAVGSGGLILHSVDGGVTWQLQSSCTEVYDLYTIRLDATGSFGFTMGQDGVVCKTESGGATWSVYSANEQSQGSKLYSAAIIGTSNVWGVGGEGVPSAQCHLGLVLVIVESEGEGNKYDVVDLILGITVASGGAIFIVSMIYFANHFIFGTASVEEELAMMEMPLEGTSNAVMPTNPNPPSTPTRPSSMSVVRAAKVAPEL
eukprot:gene982-1501_t